MMKSSRSRSSPADDVGVVVGEREHAERHVARLVLHDVAHQVLQQRLLRDLEQVAERRHGEPLDDDLHAEVLEVPAAVGDRRVEQLLQALVHRPLPLELVGEVAAEDLDVARLVHGLRAGVVLGVDPRHRADELRGDDEGALLAVEELRELEGDLAVTEVVLLLRGEALVGRVAVQRIQLLGQDAVLGIDVGVPLELRRPVPLIALGLLVEVAQALLHVAVAPGVAGVEGREDGLELLVEVLELVHRGAGKCHGAQSRVVCRARTRAVVALHGVAPSGRKPRWLPAPGR